MYRYTLYIATRILLGMVLITEIAAEPIHGLVQHAKCIHIESYNQECSTQHLPRHQSTRKITAKTRARARPSAAYSSSIYLPASAQRSARSTSSACRARSKRRINSPRGDNSRFFCRPRETPAGCGKKRLAKRLARAFANIALVSALHPYTHTCIYIFGRKKLAQRRRPVNLSSAVKRESILARALAALITGRRARFAERKVRAQPATFRLQEQPLGSPGAGWIDPGKARGSRCLF